MSTSKDSSDRMPDPDMGRLHIDLPFDEAMRRAVRVPPMPTKKKKPTSKKRK